MPSPLSGAKPRPCSFSSPDDRLRSSGDTYVVSAGCVPAEGRTRTRRLVPDNNGRLGCPDPGSSPGRAIPASPAGQRVRADRGVRICATNCAAGGDRVRRFHPVAAPRPPPPVRSRLPIDAGGFLGGGARRRGIKIELLGPERLPEESTARSAISIGAASRQYIAVHVPPTRPSPIMTPLSHVS
jgi:hypothetical protein